MRACRWKIEAPLSEGLVNTFGRLNVKAVPAKRRAIATALTLAGTTEIKYKKWGLNAAIPASAVEKKDARPEGRASNQSIRHP